MLHLGDKFHCFAGEAKPKDQKIGDIQVKGRLRCRASLESTTAVNEGRLQAKRIKYPPLFFQHDSIVGKI